MERDGVQGPGLPASWNIPPVCLPQTEGSLFQSGKEDCYDNSNYCHSCCDRMANTHDDHGYYPQKAEVTLNWGAGKPAPQHLTFTIHRGLGRGYTPFRKEG